MSRLGPSEINTEKEGDLSDSEKPALPSSIQPVRPRKPSVEDTEAGKQRNRRMFGVLVTTLTTFQKKDAAPTTSAQRFAEIDSRLKEQSKKERHEVYKIKTEIIETRNSKQRELEELELKKQEAEKSAFLDKHAETLGCFIKTKATPSIFYLPSKHTEATQRLAAESRAAILEARKLEREAALAGPPGEQAADASVGEKDKEKDEVNDDDVVNADVGALEEKMETSEDAKGDAASSSKAADSSHATSESTQEAASSSAGQHNEGKEASADVEK